MLLMPKKLISKKLWKNAVGASIKPKRLHLKLDKDGLFNCPILYCDSDSYRSIRGCRKHVHQRHGWFYYFDKKPNVEDVFPNTLDFLRKEMQKTKRSRTTDIPTFKSCLLYTSPSPRDKRQSRMPSSA